MNYKLGKLPATHDTRTLKLRNYLSSSIIVPTSIDYSYKVNKYDMLLNDKLGCCVISGILHSEQTTDSNADKNFIPSDELTLQLYESIGGYSPNNPNTDNGCNMLIAMNYWKKNGLINGNHTINAYASVKKCSENIKRAIYLFGSLPIGLLLPDSVCEGNLALNPWDDNVGGSPNDSNGHCVILTSYDSNGVTCVTWGAKKLISWKFLLSYSDEIYAVISDDWFNGGKSISGFDLYSLQKDLNEITK